MIRLHGREAAMADVEVCASTSSSRLRRLIRAELLLAAAAPVVLAGCSFVRDFDQFVCDPGVDCDAPPPPCAGAELGGECGTPLAPLVTPVRWVMAVVEDTAYDDFVAGDFGRSRVHLYAAADGTIRTVRRSDVDNDGNADLVHPNFFDPGLSVWGTLGYECYSDVFLGSDAGLDFDTRWLLRTRGAVQAVVADFDVDGRSDIAFCNGADATSESYVYYGVEDGPPDLTHLTRLPTPTCRGLATADLNRDGWLDLVFANNSDGVGDYTTDSYVYFGSADGFSSENRRNLPTVGANSPCLGDLDDDGHVDVFITADTTSASRHQRSYIFWGTADGPEPENPGRTLPTDAAGPCAVADISPNGHLDVVIANHMDDDNEAVDSVVFLGTEAGPTTTSGSWALPTMFASGVSVADLDGNDRLDVVVSSLRDRDWSFEGSVSTIFYQNTLGSFDPVPYPATIGATGSQVLDWDGDGYLDLYFASRGDDRLKGVQGIGMYFPGGPDGPATEPARTIETSQSMGLQPDFGNTFDRGWVEEFQSRVFDLGSAADVTSLEFDAVTPGDSSVSFQVRSAETAAALLEQPWEAGEVYDASPARLSAAHGGRRFVQYRFEIENPNAAAAPIIDAVRLRFERRM